MQGARKAAVTLAGVAPNSHFHGKLTTYIRQPKKKDIRFIIQEQKKTTNVNLVFPEMRLNELLEKIDLLKKREILCKLGLARPSSFTPGVLIMSTCMQMHKLIDIAKTSLEP